MSHIFFPNSECKLPSTLVRHILIFSSLSAVEDGSMMKHIATVLLAYATAAVAASRSDGRSSNLRSRAMEMNHTREELKDADDIADDAVCGGTAPIQVFVLAGQSNMEGWGSMEHLEMLLKNETTSAEYAHLWNDMQDTWATLDDVYVNFGRLRGPLAPGFGAFPEWFGPELGFGWNIHEHLASCDKPILLLKVAFGGRDLAIDFRPPSSGIGNYEKDGSGNLYNATGGGPFNETTYGHEYRNMLHIITNTLENRLSQVVMNYKAPLDGPTYSLEGLVWFQGFNDVVDEDKAKEYEFNLANLIRDLRQDLNETNLPIVIGELGTFGSEEYGFQLPEWPYVRELQQAQRNVTEMDEFRNNTRYVSTGRYLIDDQESWQQLHHYCKSCLIAVGAVQKTGGLSSHRIASSRTKITDGRADTYYHIGHDFGEAMADLLGLMDNTAEVFSLGVDGV